MNRILITGCQRSGTTLMGLIMDSHPLISNVDEADFKSVDDLSTEFHSCAKLPQVSADVDYIKNEFKADTVIWMVRNPFDVIKSMMNLQISRGRSRTESWGSTYSHVEISKMLQYLPSESLFPHQKLLDQYRAVLANSVLRCSDQGNILSCITCWVLKQECYKYLKLSGLNVVLVRYEDLVSSPEIILADLFSELKIEWHTDTLRHHELHSGISIGKTLNTRAIDQSSLFYSKKYFNDSELKLISGLSSSARMNFEYPSIDSNRDYENSANNSDDDTIEYTTEWIVFWLSMSVVQKSEKKFISTLSHVLKNQTLFSETIFDRLCILLFDDWAVMTLSNNSHLNLSIRLNKYLGSVSVKKQTAFSDFLANKSQQWQILSAYYKKSSVGIDFIEFYKKDGANHDEVAQALAFMIGHYGSSENILDQWSCLMGLAEAFPNLKYVKDVAMALVNTLPPEVDGAGVLLSWFDEELNRQELHKIFYKFIHKTSVDIDSLQVKDFPINTFSDSYMVWRLGRLSVLNEDGLSQSKTAFFSKELQACGFEPVDFEGEASIYVGPKKPAKLIICFTGFGSMLMHPLSLIHSVIDVDDDVGILWLQDLHSKVFLSGEDGQGDMYSYTKHLIKTVEQYGAEYVSVIASSGACYTSLYFSSVYPVYRCVTLSPYTFLAEEKYQDLMQRKFGPLFKGNVDVVKDMGNLEPETRSYFGEKNSNDKQQSEHLLSRKNVELMPIKDVASHDLGDSLIEGGHYKDMFSWMTSKASNGAVEA